MVNFSTIMNTVNTFGIRRIRCEDLLTSCYMFRLACSSVL